MILNKLIWLQLKLLADVDKYMLAQLNDLIKGYHKAYDN